MASQASICLLLALFTCASISSSLAYTFYVGDKQGWVTNPSEDYNLWAGRNRFSVNDTIVFKYKNASESVLQVKKDDYDNCSTTNPIKTLNSSGSATSVFKFDLSGPFFFISGYKENCLHGQRLHVVVLAIRPTPGHPSPPQTPIAKPPSPLSPAFPPSSTGKPPSLAPSPMNKPPSHAPTSPSPSPAGPVSSPSPSPAGSEGPVSSPPPSPAGSEGPVNSPSPSPSSPPPATVTPPPSTPPATSPPQPANTPPSGPETTPPASPPGSNGSANVGVPTSPNSASWSLNPSIIVTVVLGASLFV